MIVDLDEGEHSAAAFVGQGEGLAKPEKVLIEFASSPDPSHKPPCARPRGSLGARWLVAQTEAQRSTRPRMILDISFGRTLF